MQIHAALRNQYVHKYQTSGNRLNLKTKKVVRIQDPNENVNPSSGENSKNKQYIPYISYEYVNTLKGQNLKNKFENFIVQTIYYHAFDGKFGEFLGKLILRLHDPFNADRVFYVSLEAIPSADPNNNTSNMKARAKVEIKELPDFNIGKNFYVVAKPFDIFYQFGILIGYIKEILINNDEYINWKNLIEPIRNLNNDYLAQKLQKEKYYDELQIMFDNIYKKKVIHRILFTDYLYRHMTMFGGSGFEYHLRTKYKYFGEGK